MNQVLQGDCLEILKTLPDNSVDAIVTDPPYGLSFMGKAWDYDVPIVGIWRECLRVIKPGGHLLAFAATRTQHRMAVNIEDAGFEIRDMIALVYGSGFPKSHNISKALDDKAGAEREVVGYYSGASNIGKKTDGKWGYGTTGESNVGADLRVPATLPATPEAKQWDGWGTALKPALEPITVARKPFKGSVADNVLEHGTGGINVDGCRVGDELMAETKSDGSYHSDNGTMSGHNTGRFHTGRWPANFIHDGSNEATRLLQDSARFFYCPKASKGDREDGLDCFDIVSAGALSGSKDGSLNSHPCMGRNPHPTVKPTDLMRYLVRLVTPPGGVVLDPFCGSGSTGRGAVLEGFQFIGIERETEYVEIAKARIISAVQESNQLTIEDRIQWLETQVKHQGIQLKKIQHQQLSLFG